MSRNKFLLIRRFLHINAKEKEIPGGQQGFDPWVKVRYVLDHLNNSFKHYYVPSQTISIDKSLVGMKNKTVYLQYLKKKPHARFGIKKFELCDVSGHVMHVAMYAGKDFDLRCRQGQAHAVVIELLKESRLLHKGYHLYTDRFYTKPVLAEDLETQRTFLTGTVNANSRGLPPGLSAPLAIGGTRFKRKGNMLAVAFREKKSQKKPVLLLSTGHAAQTETKTIRNKQVTKPVMIFDYNLYMGGVDLSDQKIYHYAAERATHRYWVKIFCNLLDIALLNSFELYKVRQPPPCMNKRSFVLAVIEALCRLSAPPATPSTSRPPATPSSRSPTSLPSATPPAAVHRLYLLDGRKEMNCVVCAETCPKAKRVPRSRHWCPMCEVGVYERCEAQFTHPGPTARRGRKRKL